MWIVELLLLTYFVYVVGYTATFSIAGQFYREPHENKDFALRRFCVFIPCYKGDDVIVEVAKKALEQSYKSNYYTVVVIADSLQAETLSILRTLPIQVIEVHFENSTKVKSLREALNRLPENFDYAVILDTDNIMASDFISRMNSVLSSSTRAVQGQRKPKNQNNSLAVLDGVSEAINNHIYRQGTVSLGLSASISGSGVAFDYLLFKEKINSMNSVGGFDRELELLLLADGVKVQYHKNAIVFDEKVSQTKTFTNQVIAFLYLALQMGNVPPTSLAKLPDLMDQTIEKVESAFCCHHSGRSSRESSCSNGLQLRTVPLLQSMPWREEL